MHSKKRHFLIIKDVNEKTVVTVPDLVTTTGASEATIRRDIAELDKADKLIKIRGGAESKNSGIKSTLKGRPFEINEEINQDKKKAIANCAASLCENGDSIILCGGTTLFSMAKALKEKKMTVLTNSLPNMEFLLNHTDSTVMMPGGLIYREQNILLSPYEDKITKSFYAKHCFFSALSAGPNGPMEADVLIINSVTRFLNQSLFLILLLDSSKFNSKGSLIIHPWEKINTVITDNGLDKEKRKWIQDLGIKLIIAPELKQEN
ncbi:MAG: DeoR/GlpR transcriptional regulator [Desulfobacteraceae bacterium]|nr:DeoR/GlpR transcriptional regulator [Desulfobacteraceae bacterium]